MIRTHSFQLILGFKLKVKFFIPFLLPGCNWHVQENDNEGFMKEKAG